ITVIDMVGDIDCSNSLREQIKKDNPTYFVAMGDLCYEPDLAKFEQTYDDLKKYLELACLIGNHDAEEDGNPKIYEEAEAFCNDHWYLKIAKGTTLLIGLNTNGDMEAQASWGQSLATNSTLMSGVKNVILLSHKPAHTPPKSHHPVEAPVLEMYTAIESKIPIGLNVYEIAGHNHFMAESKDGKWFISGAGGRSHYEGETDSIWTFLNNKDYGYLQLKIDNNSGKLTSNFFGLDGSLIH
ncbi:MAG: metallophosphoesterase, partial [Nitrososphaeraceae archaeon]